MHLQPEAYTSDDTDNKATDFGADIEDMIGRSLTEEEKASLRLEAEAMEQLDEDDIDTIERVY